MAGPFGGPLPLRVAVVDRPAVVGDQHRRAVAARQRGQPAGCLVPGLLVLLAVGDGPDRCDAARCGGRAVGGGGCLPVAAAVPLAEDAVLVVGRAQLVRAERRLEFDRSVDDGRDAPLPMGRPLGERGQLARRVLQFIADGAAGQPVPPRGVVLPATGGTLGEERPRDEDHGGGAAVRRGLQGDPDVLPLGEPADHEQTEPVGVGQLELGGLGQPEVGLQQQVGGHAQPAVVDLQGVAVGDPLAQDLDGGVRRREDGGVLQEFGYQVREVRDRGAVHREPRQPAHLDPLVVLHLGDRRAHHVHQLDGFAPLPGGGRAGEDDQALRVPAHAGGQMVDPEEVGEFVGVLGAPFHGVQQGQLAVQQDLAAAREVDEHLGDAPAHFGLFDGGLDRGPLEGVERLPDLAGFVRAEFEPGASVSTSTCSPPPAGA